MNRIKTGKRIYKSKIQLIKINLSWVLPKAKREHRVPLPDRAIDKIQ